MIARCCWRADDDSGENASVTSCATLDGVAQSGIYLLTGAEVV